ncbi:uncharacterized protein LOC124171266 [Ischnura elegans]|uniref:uncharacterized protein LOC124171266 n=1 Tax=Ischnura elegans TaxID=197161 RepID=UPI001ED86C83|nr:uncharacterized protein LOC124171266 [Ischnura elegans]
MSHHHPAQKASVVSSLLHRAFTVSDADSLESEKRLLTKALRKNGYNQKMVLKRAENVAKLHARPPMERHTTEEDSMTPAAKLTIPYIAGTSERIARILKKHDVVTRFNCVAKIHDAVPGPKDQIPQELYEGVYQVPCSFKHHLNTYAAKKILRRTSEALLRERIHHKKLELHLCSEELYRIHLELGATLTATDWEKIDKISFESSRALETTHRESQIKKYVKLNSRQHPKLESGPDKDRSIVNLTDLHIDDATTSVLAKGLNFAITPRDIPREKIITEVETGIRILPRLVADEIREDVARVLRNAKPPKPNMTAGERTALKALRENQDILILPADKGNATVLMKQVEYQKKISELLSDTIYRKLGKNPMAKAERETKAIIKKSSIPLEEKRGLITSAPKPPRLYGLPKVHKEGVPLRPIVSQIDAPTYRLAKYLARTLQNHTGTTTTHVKNSAHFVEMIRYMTIANEDIMVSFDVVSLFTNVPIAESVEIVRTLVDSGIPKDFPDLVNHCLRNSIFLWNGDFYDQSDGAAMGSPLSPVVANLFMERFEAEAINTYDKKPKKWLRYVDDTFIIWPHGTEELDRFLNHLNSWHQNIRFTMEKERDGKLPFLDVMVRRKGDGSLAHAVYRKATHTNRYLNATSHHHPAQKASVVSSLLHRAFTVSNPDSLESEKRLLTTTTYAQHRPC